MITKKEARRRAAEFQFRADNLAWDRDAKIRVWGIGPSEYPAWVQLYDVFISRTLIRAHRYEDLAKAPFWKRWTA